MDIPEHMRKMERYATPKKGVAPTLRQDLISKFLEKLNESRKEAGYKPLTFGHLARQLKGLTDAALKNLYNDCSNAREFGALFWFKIKSKK